MSKCEQCIVRQFSSLKALNKEELLRIAELSALKLEDKEIEVFVSQLKTVLDYTQQLSLCPATQEHESMRNVNVFRDDKVVVKDPALILSIAPQVEDSYFVVPAILE